MKAIAVLVAVGIIFNSCGNTNPNDAGDIIIENEQVKLVVGNDGTAKKLIYKPTNEQCLVEGEKIPIFSVSQERLFNNEAKLAHPSKETTFAADTVYRIGDNLVVGFETVPYEAVIRVKEAAGYISFSVEDFIVNESDFNVNITPPPATAITLLQLPVRNRKYFGEWLNVSWDDKISVNVLGTDRYARIEAEKRNGYRMMKAEAVKAVKLKGVGAALIVCKTEQLLDNIARVEEDYHLPKGVKSRRNERIKYSYYWSDDVNPGNVDRHLKYAKMGGFNNISLYYTSFIDSYGYRKLGDYEWNRSTYPNGKDDLKNMLTKIKDQGIVPGFHFLHSHIGRDSKYISPEPDHRLNLVKIFSLAKPIGKYDTTIFVEQNPEGITMADGCRVLKMGKELISYKGFTTTPPFQFTGCIRGIDKTKVDAQPKGYSIGLLDVSEYGATSTYIDQNTNLQDEIADKLADIYDAGFKFIYFDGSEGVNAPFWFNVSSAQYKVFNRLKPEPLFAEGAARTHFSWHMLSGGNAFDIFKPEFIKEATRKFPAEEAPRMKEDFTRINFGWIGYWVPDENTIGTQPDMIEYVTSRAAAWDCPVSIMADLKKFDSHPRTSDNLEVLRRWEEVRRKNWLTEEKKKMLQNLGQEHILLLNEQKEFELLPCEQIRNVANESKEIRAFIFTRKSDMYVVYWHVSGNKRLVLPLRPQDVRLLKDLGREVPFQSNREAGIVVPVNNRLYMKTSGMTKEKLVDAFKQAKIVD